MTERFVKNTGTISVANGSSTVTGTGTTFAGHDLQGSRLMACPVDAAPFPIGTIAATADGTYENLNLPLVTAWQGTSVIDQPYELVDGSAIANGATQAAIYARFAAFLEQSMGLIGNTADDPTYSLVPENSLFIDDVTRTLYQWRNGVLNVVSVVAQTFTPKGPWVGSPSTKTALAISTGTVDVDFSTAAGGSQFALPFDGDFELQLPTNVAESDAFDVLFTASGAEHTPSFATGFSGTAASAIGTADSARTRLRFTVTAVSGTDATAVTVSAVTFSENDLVTDGGDTFVSNADSNSAEPTGVSDSNWTLLPLPQGDPGVVALTQAEYDALVLPDATKLYVITD